jgi:Ca2+-binding RTX toxin-like protein
MADFNRADLDFILRQIRIAELNRTREGANGAPIAGVPITDLVENPLLPFGLRTVDGRENNIVPGREGWGAADTLFPRMLPPDFQPAEGGTSYASDNPSADPRANGVVIDSQPRVISNLVADQTLNNVAAIASALMLTGLTPIAAQDVALEVRAAWAALQVAQEAVVTDGATDAELATRDAAKTVLDALITDNGIQITPVSRPANVPGADPILDQYGSLVITNVAPDEGISAPFNSWMTLFGQFFDHGLDLTAKGGDGTVFIPILPGDPLYVEGGPNFMTLTRATNHTGPGADGVLGTLDDTQREHLNTTTAWVDQNQTYTSHASHQVFLRDYDRVGTETVATGHLLDGAAGTMATWTEVKAQALEMLGLKLTDYDVTKVPLLATDEYGRFLRGPNGYAQVVVRSTDANGVVTERLVEGTATGLDLEALETPNQTVVRTGHAFLDDISHAAGPYDAATGARKLEDGNSVVGLGEFANDGFVTGPYAATFVETWQLEKRANIVSNPLYQGPSETDPGFADYVTNFLSRVNATTGLLEPIPYAQIPIALRPYLKTSEVYDGELLGRHFMTGDGRGNENIGLTAVHDVFHSEHNRLAEQTKDVALAAAQAGDIAFLNEWLRVDLDPATVVPTDPVAYSAFVAGLQWDGERLFQAARVGTEMQYQHLVFEEFARKVTPAIDLFVFNPTVDVNPAIFAEFAHVVYRFGHSMLNETVDRVFDANTQESMTLVDAFLNPVAFNNDGGLSADVASGAIVRGMTRQAGNAIDEFVTDALRNFLVGVPLDLPALNIARGRDTGVPTLNAAREAFFAESGSDWVRPYTGWTDFQDNLKNPMSVVNFIAAYGTHASLQGNLTTEQKRDAALRLVFGDEMFDGPAGLAATPGVTIIRGVSYSDADVLAFLGGTGVYASNKGGLDNVDLWIGGLAERTIPFGGMLGATFTYVFEKQLENLQNGDRFYYLSRMQGTHFLTELESNSFAELIMNNTELNGAHLPGEIFSTPNYILEVNTGVQNDYNGAAAGLDPTTGVTRATDFAISGVTYTNYLRFIGGEHVVLGGTDGIDALISGLGDDTLWGDGGNDLLNGGDGVNRLHGGAGNDRIFDGGDASFLHGEDGDDFISAGAGAGELIFGDAGNDYILMGSDLKEAFAGEGNDFVLGTADTDILIGGEGDDWLEGGEGFDTTAGDNSELFFNSAIIGHDVMFSGTNEHDFDAESGDDIMVQGESVMRSEGMFGFDWGIYKGNNIAANADLNIKIENTAPANVLRNRFDQVEALSGWNLNDRLFGDNRGPATGPFDPNGVPAADEFFGDGLDGAGVARVSGLRELLGLTQAQLAVFGDAGIVFQDGNILIGGDGNDFIQGNGANDIVDGDKWMNVRIAILDNAGVEIGSVERLAPRETLASNTAALNLVQIYAPGHAWNGRSISSLVESGALTGSNMRIVREIKTDGSPGNNTDTAAFRGNRSEYTFAAGLDANGAAITTVTHATPATVAVNDGVDTLRGIERLHFADGGLFSASIDENAANAGGLHVGRMVREFTSGTVTFAGPDASQFSYNATTGEIRFIGSNLDFESPSDLNRDNVFTATLRHQNASGDVYVDFIEVTVNNVDETNAGTMRIVSGTANDAETAVTLTVSDVRTDLDLVTTLNPQGIVSQVANYQWQRHNGTAWVSVANVNGVAGATTSTISGLADGRFRLQSTHVENGATVRVHSEEVYVGTGASQTVLAGSAGEWVFGLDGNDVLFGGLGADMMFGGLGHDTYLVDSIQDVVTEDADAGTDEIRSTVDFSLANALGVENLTLQGTALMATGNGLNNIIRGNASANDLDGGDGDDVLFGGNGGDFILGGNGSDLLKGEAGQDVLSGGDGIDTLDLSTDAAAGGNNGVYVDLSASITLDGFSSYDVISGIENVIGTDSLYVGFAPYSDLIFGSAEANVIQGRGGHDYVEGRGGADGLYGETGNDILLGGDGNDSLIFGAGNDYAVGGDGSDAFYVLGDDVRGGDVDAIADFEVGVDNIAISASLRGQIGMVEASPGLVVMYATTATGGWYQLVYGAGATVESVTNSTFYF